MVDKSTEELIHCPYCGYMFRIALMKLLEAGQTIAIRGPLDPWEIKPEIIDSIDIQCPHCNKWFEWEIKS